MSETNDVTLTTEKQHFLVDDFQTHMIDPKKKDAKWGYNIFLFNKQYLRTSFAATPYVGGWSIDYELIKQYATGNQPVGIYKVQFDPQDKKAIYTGLNWNIAPIIPTIRTRIIKKMMDVPSEVNCQAVDEMANSQRNMDKLRLKAQPILDKKLEKLSSMMGYDTPMKSGMRGKILSQPPQMQGMDMPMESDDEIDILMDKESGYYNQNVEIANEIAIKAIFQWNEFDELRKLLQEDVFDIGLYTFRTFINAYNGMPTFQYLRPDRVYINQSKFRDYHDANMWYYPVPSTLSDIMNYFGDELTEEDVKIIWEKSAKRRPASWNGNYPLGYGWDWRRWNESDLRKVEIDMFYFEVKTQNTVTYEISKTKTGKKKVKQKPYDYAQPEDSQYDKQRQDYWAEVWYKGYYIQGMEKVYDWGMLNDQYRSKEDPQHCNSSLNIYRASEKGWTEMMIPWADAFQLNFLKWQHGTIRALPKGINWNWDAISQPFIGTSGTITAEKIMQMFYQTGSGMYHSLDENGDMILANGNASHQIMENGPAKEDRQYVENMAFSVNQMSSCVGISPTSDAVTPQPKQLVGVTQAAIAASDSAQFLLISCTQRLVTSTAEYVSYCLQEIAKNNKKTWEKIKFMIGSYNTTVIESMDNYAMRDFAIYAKPYQDDAQKQFLMTAVTQALSQSPPTIGITDGYNILFIGNTKLGMKLFELKQKKGQEMMMQSQQAQAQAAMQQEQMMNQVKMALEQMKGDNAVRNTESGKRIDYAIAMLQETGDTNRKILSELNKRQIKDKEMQNDKEYLDAEHEKESIIIDKEASKEHDLIEHQKTADIELERSKPKPTKAK